MFRSFQKNYQKRVDDGESAATVIAEEYHNAIKAGKSTLGGTFKTGKKGALEKALKISFDSMGAIPLPLALTQGLIAYWTGAVYVYTPPLVTGPTPLVPGVPPPMVVPTPNPIAGILPVFIAHLPTIVSTPVTPSPGGPVPTPDVGFIPG